MKKLKFLIPTLSLITISSAICSDIDTEISRGVESKRIEALLAQKIHNITPKYDSQLSVVLKGRDANFPLLFNSADRARQLAILARSLILNMLLDLWQFENLETVERCIRVLSITKDDCQGFDMVPSSPASPPRFFVNHNVFFKLCTQPFYHSRTLFGLALVPQILTLAYGPLETGKLAIRKVGYDDQQVHHQKFIEEVRKKGYLLSSSQKPTKVREYNFIFSPTASGTHPYTVQIRNKINGGQFGGIFIASDGTTPKSYFVKTYYGYPAKAGLNSEAAFEATTTGIMSSDLLDGSAIEAPYNQVDFKELFTYKVLELIELGPKVHFMLNPYLKDGLFIVSEDLNSPHCKFIEMGKIDNALDAYLMVALQNLRLGKTDISKYRSFNSVIRMLEVDTVNRVFTLNDFNTGNVGYLQTIDEEESDDEEDDDDNLGTNWLQIDHAFKIIDFLPSIRADQKYIVPEIGETFLDGNSITKYDSRSIMYTAIFRKIDPGERIFRKMPPEKMAELREKNVQEKLFFGTKVIESLEARFKGNLEAILQASKQQIMDFIISAADIIGFTTEYIKAGMQDIDMYIAGILQNYYTLKDFIISESKKLLKE